MDNQQEQQNYKQKPQIPQAKPASKPNPWMLSTFALLLLLILLCVYTLNQKEKMPTIHPYLTERITLAPTTILPPSSPATNYFNKPTGSATTAGWKTYTNNTYQYSFKYPPSWNTKLIQYQNTGHGDLAPSFKGVSLDNPDPAENQSIIVTVEENPQQLDPITYFTEYPIGETGIVGDPIGTYKEKQRRIAEKMIKNSNKVLVDNKEALKFENVPGPIPTTQVALFKDNLVVKFIMEETLSTDTETTFNQILSTFQFID